MTNNFILQTIKVTLIDIGLEIIYFPIWWYGKGLVKAFKLARKNIIESWQSLGMDIFLRSMFKPMYGDYTISGRIISFVMRILILIAKLVQLLLWIIFSTVVIVVWLILPIFVIYQIVNYGASK